MKPDAVPVHAVKMFHYCDRVRQQAKTVRASIAESSPDEAAILPSLNCYAPISANLPTQFVQEHADELIRDIGFGPSCGRTQF
jgi:hypothetical protein